MLQSMLLALYLILKDYDFLCSANEHIIVYACDCSSETLERAEEIIDAATVVSVIHRFRTFCCDFSVTGFPKWLVCHTCQEVFLQKQQNCLPGFELHLLPCWTIIVPLCNMYSRFLFASIDVKESNGRHFNDSYSLKESGCCIGGVDFVTLVCIFIPLDVPLKCRKLNEVLVF